MRQDQAAGLLAALLSQAAAVYVMWGVAVSQLLDAVHSSLSECLQ